MTLRRASSSSAVFCGCATPSCRRRVVHRAVVDGDRRELARDRRRPSAAPLEVRDVERHGLRFGWQPLAPDPGGEGAEVAPVGGVGALA
jgi:hypothetical protein